MFADWGALARWRWWRVRVGVGARAAGLLACWCAGALVCEWMRWHAGADQLPVT
ncbi:MAG TPA: hypothetical protein PLZ57_12335 [Pseudobdellovibrionaceae bacterium]|nr:hypothetical protein [Pseudobdellovibrionaceae bacterium]